MIPNDPITYRVKHRLGERGGRRLYNLMGAISKRYSHIVLSGRKSGKKWREYTVKGENPCVVRIATLKTRWNITFTSSDHVNQQILAHTIGGYLQGGV